MTARVSPMVFIIFLILPHMHGYSIDNLAYSMNTFHDSSTP